MEVDCNGRKRDLWAVRVMRPMPGNVQPEVGKHAQPIDVPGNSNPSQSPSIPEGILGVGKDAMRPRDDRVIPTGDINPRGPELPRLH